MAKFRSVKYIYAPPLPYDTKRKRYLTTHIHNRTHKHTHTHIYTHTRAHTRTETTITKVISSPERQEIINSRTYHETTSHKGS